MFAGSSLHAPSAFRVSMGGSAQGVPSSEITVPSSNAFLHFSGIRLVSLDYSRYLRIFLPVDNVV